MVQAAILDGRYLSRKSRLNPPFSRCAIIETDGFGIRKRPPFHGGNNFVLPADTS